MLSRFRLAAFSGTTLLSAACSAPREPESSQARQPILDAEVVGEGYEYVVQVRSVDDQVLCTGTLIAPNLVLVNRVCIASDENTGLLDCDPNDPFKTTPVLGQVQSNVEVYTGYETYEAGRQPDAVASKVFVTSDVDACTHDIALVLLDRDLPITPASLKLDDGDDPLVVKEKLTVVGFGVVDVKGTATERLRKKEGELLAIGPSFYARDPWPEFQLAESLLFAGTGACIGDSGAPLVRAKSNAVFGYVHLIKNLDASKAGVTDFTKPWTICEGETAAFTAVDLRYHTELIMKGFEASGYVPHREGRPAPSSLGASCELDIDCHSGLCVTVGDAQSCSQECSSAACPSEFVCVGRSGSRYCISESAAAPEEPDGGCSVDSASPRSRSGQWGSLLVLALLAGRVRRRSRRAKLSE